MTDNEKLIQSILNNVKEIMTVVSEYSERRKDDISNVEIILVNLIHNEELDKQYIKDIESIIDLTQTIDVKLSNSMNKLDSFRGMLIPIIERLKGNQTED